MQEQHIRELMRRAFVLGYQWGQREQDMPAPIVSKKVLTKIIKEYNDERKVL